MLQPTVDELARRGTPFVGLLYAGLALTGRGVRVIEFNARFGDPETQPLLAAAPHPARRTAARRGDRRAGRPAGAGVGEGAAVAVVLAAQSYPPVAGHRRGGRGLDVAGTDRPGRPGGHRAGSPTGRWSAPAAGCWPWSASATTSPPPGPGVRGHRRDRPGRIVLPQRHRQRRPAVAMSVGNVLANRYASAAMREVWSAESKIIAERRLWLAVLAAQRDLGVDFGGDDPEAVIAAYEAVVDQVDLASIAEREKVTRHDVKARIEEFNALAGFEHVHKGMTSRDLTENVEQLQIVSSLKIIRDRIVATLVQLGAAGRAVRRPAMAGRSHNVAAQITTLGKRFATAANELLIAYERVDGADRPLPAARHQGSGRDQPGHARPGRRRRGPAGRARAADRRPPGLRRGTWSAPARSIRARWTTTWSPHWPRSRPRRPTWPPASG